MLADPGRIDEEATRLQAVNIAKARFRSREFALGDDIRRQLARVTVPVRAIWGARDVLAQPSPEAAFAAIRATHPELVARTVPDAGHWVMYEQAEAFNHELAVMLRLR
jgi:pimeloyl-ACP methyl ester carboxylesterase